MFYEMNIYISTSHWRMTSCFLIVYDYLQNNTYVFVRMQMMFRNEMSIFMGFGHCPLNIGPASEKLAQY